MLAARVSAGIGLVAGLLTIGVLILEAPVPLQYCVLPSGTSFLPPGCVGLDLTRHNPFWGDSQAAPVFQLLLNFVAPLVTLAGAMLASVGRRWVGFGLAAASLLVLAWAHIVTHFLFPLQTLVLVSVFATVVALGRMMWGYAIQGTGGPVSNQGRTLKV